jgi:hypothetical protein
MFTCFLHFKIKFRYSLFQKATNFQLIRRESWGGNFQMRNLTIQVELNEISE